MKILHVTPHLGGGVGKAHAALRSVMPREVDQTFVLLEPARDRRFVDMIEAAGGHVTVADGFEQIGGLATEADVMQVEFWNHPRLFAALARTGFPAMRSVFWSHVSGLARPVIQPALIEKADRFVFTTAASLSAPALRALPKRARDRIAVINSGFGFAEIPRHEPARGRMLVIAYLGTVDFVKMHPGFFKVIDQLDDPDIRVWVWGNPSPAVKAAARAMRHPNRIHFGGHADDPARALSAAQIFFYPLQREHYGTAENALVEAMSLGLVPVVLDNPAEAAIVRHGETGFVAHSIEEGAALLQMLLASPDVREQISRNAAHDIAQIRTPARSAQDFVTLWRSLLNEPKRVPNFRAAIGDSPADWFLATQCLPGETWRPSAQTNPESSAKGTLAHFTTAFPHDPSLARLLRAATAVA